MRIFLMGIGWLILCPLLSWSVTTGEHAAEFLNMGAGARGIAMGGSFVAVADDATAAYWNPAGLTSVRSHGFSAMYADVFETGEGGVLHQGLVHYSFLNYATRFNHRDALALSWIRMGVDDIPRTTFEDTNGNGVLGDFLDTNDNGVKDAGEIYLDRPTIAEMFSNTDDALLISYARKALPSMAVGGNLKFIRQSIDENRGVGWGVDLGVKAYPLDDLELALMVQDALGTRIQWDTEEAPTFTRKPSIHLGVAYHPRLPILGEVMLAVDARSRQADVTQDKGMGWQIHYGLEYWILDVLALRVGMAQTRFAAGAGFQIPLGTARIRADYAFSTHELGDSQRLSITGQF